MILNKTSGKKEESKQQTLGAKKTVHETSIIARSFSSAKNQKPTSPNNCIHLYWDARHR